jgi:signal transduction histidine kinase
MDGSRSADRAPARESTVGSAAPSTAGPERLDGRVGQRETAPNQRRYVLRIVGAASLPLIVLVVFGIVQGKVLAEGRVAEERIALAQAGALTAAAFVDGNLLTARSLSRVASIMAPSSTPELQATFESILAENPDWEGWGLAGPDGWNVVSTGAQPGTLNVSDRPYFQEAITAGRSVVSPAVLNRRTGNPTVVLAVPVQLETGRGAIIVSLSTARLASEMRALRQDASVRISLVDAVGTLFASPDSGPLDDLPSLRGRPAVDAALQGEAGSTVVGDESDTETLVAYAPVPAFGWGVVVAQPTSAAFDVVRRQTALGIVILGLAATLAGAIGWNLGGRLAELYQRQRAATLRAEATTAMLAQVSTESERRRRFLEEVIDSAPVAIAILRGTEYRHETLNARYQALRPADAIAGRSITEVFPRETAEPMRETFDRVFASGEQAVLVDRAWNLHDGAETSKERYFTHVVARLDDEGGQPDAILSIVLETTDVVLARQRAQREKDEMLSTASHELKTPLTSLGLAAQMIDRMVEGGTIDQQRLTRHLTTIRSQVARLSRLMSTLLDVSRIETGRSALHWESVDLALLAQIAVARERDTLPDNSPHRIVLRSDASSVVAQGDEARLEQVVVNLISNAVKYSPAGGAIDVTVGRDQDHAVLEVADRGIGVPVAERDRLFAPFSRTPSAIDAGIEGTGLGLYISRKIVEAHGGSIDHRETLGGGTTFRVSLPLERRNVSETASDVSPEAGVPSSGAA